MPPKVKFRKEEIVQAALDVARVKGADGVTARDIAAQLGVSTRPIFTYFNTMDEVKTAVRQAAEQVYQDYTAKGAERGHPLFGLRPAIPPLRRGRTGAVQAALSDPAL